MEKKMSFFLGQRPNLKTPYFTHSAEMNKISSGLIL